MCIGFICLRSFLILPRKKCNLLDWGIQIFLLSKIICLSTLKILHVISKYLKVQFHLSSLEEIILVCWKSEVGSLEFSQCLGGRRMQLVLTPISNADVASQKSSCPDVC